MAGRNNGFSNRGIVVLNTPYHISGISAFQLWNMIRWLYDE